MQNNPGHFPGTLLVVGLDGQTLAQSAARGGVRPVVLDTRGGADLHRWSHSHRRIRRDSWHGGLETTSLLASMERLCPQRVCLGVVYSTGFEANSTLLTRLGEQRRLYGNSPATVALASDPHAFFPFLDGLGIPHPAIGKNTPPSHGPWLIKRIGGNGGSHIHVANPREGYCDDDSVYYQQQLRGRSLSVQLIADGQHCRVLGVSEKWTIPTSHISHRHSPFLSGGAISDAPLERPLRDTLTQIATTLTSAMGLIGLNSIEVIVSCEQAHVVKLTPCPDALVSLYDHRYPGGLFAHHLRACRGVLPVVNENHARVRGLSHVYLPGPLNAAGTWRWPWWSSNHSDGLTQNSGRRRLPAAGNSPGGLSAGDHLCSVNASGENPASVRARLRQRERDLLADLVSIRLTA